MNVRLFPISLAEQITCVEREIAMRERVYPRWVDTGKLSHASADHELLCMKAVLETLQNMEAAPGDAGTAALGS